MLRTVVSDRIEDGSEICGFVSIDELKYRIL
jgi:hypothetical protein